MLLSFVLALHSQLSIVALHRQRFLEEGEAESQICLVQRIQADLVEKIAPLVSLWRDVAFLLAAVRVLAH